MASLFAGMAIIILVVGMPILPWHYNSAQRSSSSGEISGHGRGPGETSPSTILCTSSTCDRLCSMCLAPASRLAWLHAIDPSSSRLGRLPCGLQQACLGNGAGSRKQTSANQLKRHMQSWWPPSPQLYKACGRHATRTAAARAGNSSNPLGLPGAERKLKQVELIMGDKTELADVEICLKPDGSDWLLGIGASSRVRPGLCTWSCPVMDTNIHCGLGVCRLLFS